MVEVPSSVKTGVVEKPSALAGGVFTETNLRHPSLHTHKYNAIEGPCGEEVFESYAQNKTPGAYRLFWHYGPGKKTITILEICPHP